MNALQLSSKVTLNVCILGIECLLKGLFGLSQSLNFNLVGFYACIKVVQFFLNDKQKDTSAFVRRSLNDIGLTKVIFITYGSDNKSNDELR
jgi:hypothetical protein